MNQRALRLRKETLARLEDGTLRSVGGASHGCGVTDACTHGPSLDAGCPTTPVLTCVGVSPESVKLSCAVCLETIGRSCVVCD